MPGIDYTGIRDEIKSILAGDARTSMARIYIEEEPQFGLSDVAKAILIFLDRRSAAPARQRLAAGQTIHYHLQITLAVVCFEMESFEKAAIERDDLVANMELVLMTNHTLNGKVDSSWLEGGELFSARNPQNQAFVAVAETTLTADVTASL